MKSTVLFIIACLFNFWPALVHSQNVEIKAFKISKIGPVFDNDLKITGYDTTVDFVYYYKDLKIYSRLVPLDNIFFGTLMSTEHYERVFVHQSDSLYGYLTDSVMNIHHLRQHIDSGSYSKTYFNNAIENDFKALNILPLQQNLRINEHLFKDVYLITSRLDTTVKSTWTLTYSDDFKNHPVSISHYMDSIRSSKLIEIKTDEPERFIKEYNKTIPKYHFIFRLDPIIDFDLKKIQKYFDEYLAIISQSR